ncbi:hypothetical protein SFyv_6175 [Shigella flexneri Shi06HN006]|nr:hypothetical protein SFyv_6175 [Shigella flexneri Shi06HN006]
MILCNFLVYSAAGRASFLLPGDFHLRQQHRTTLYITACFNIVTDGDNIAPHIF